MSCEWLVTGAGGQLGSVLLRMLVEDGAAALGLGLSDRCIIPTRQSDMAFAEPRPADVSLDCGLYSKIFDEAPGRAMAEVMAEIAAEVARD